MKDIKFNCPWCDQRLEAPQEMKGVSLLCPACQIELRIPIEETGERTPSAIPQEAHSDQASEPTAEACRSGTRKDTSNPLILKCCTCGRIMAKELKTCPHCGAARKPTMGEESLGNFAVFCALLSALIIFFPMYSSCAKALTNPVAPVAPSANVKIGTSSRAICKCYGARSKDDLERAFDMQKTGDAAAFTEMFLTGRLVTIPEGTSVSIEDVTIMGDARVRVQGQTEPLWVNSAWFN